MTSRSTNLDPDDQASMMTTDACHEIEQDAAPSPVAEGGQRDDPHAVPLLAPFSDMVGNARRLLNEQPLDACLIVEVGAAHHA